MKDVDEIFDLSWKIEKKYYMRFFFFFFFLLGIYEQEHHKPGSILPSSLSHERKKLNGMNPYSR